MELTPKQEDALQNYLYEYCEEDNESYNDHTVISVSNTSVTVNIETWLEEEGEAYSDIIEVTFEQLGLEK